VSCCTTTQLQSTGNTTSVLQHIDVAPPRRPSARHMVRSTHPAQHCAWLTQNKGNLQHRCSPPQWWPARYQHYPSAVHKVLCAGTVATTTQPAHAVHYCTTTVLCCCLEHWNSLPPHTTCSAAAQQLHLRGVPSTGQSPSVPSQTVTIAWCILHCMQYAPTCKAVVNPDAQVAHPHVRPSWLHAS
jgi:hypothetical protein